MAACFFLDRLCCLRKEWILQVGNENAQQARVPPGEVAGVKIWPVLQLANRGLHALPSCFADAALSVDHGGDGAQRDAGSQGHVSNLRPRLARGRRDRVNASLARRCC